VKGDREGELNSREQDGIGFHRQLPGSGRFLAWQSRRIIAGLAAMRQSGKRAACRPTVACA
jgi:hypothetical protein